jgi:hypothetical protein
MIPTTRAATAAASLAVTVACAQLIPVVAHADDVQHNVTYRARVDGVSRGALISYKIDDSQVQSADPTMLPGRTFEANAVLTNPQLAGMQVSIQWPYSANLHCEILVDDATVAQADQFIGPRLTPARDDPDYGKLSCGAPLTNGIDAVNTSPVGANAPTPPGDAHMPPGFTPQPVPPVSG